MDLGKAQRSLSRRDPVLKKLIQQTGNCAFHQSSDLFGSLVRCIIAQQISTKAAATIMQRLRKDVCGGRVTAKAIAEGREEDIRKAGLSAAKMRSVRHLAEEVRARRLRLRELERLDDEAVIERLLPVKGIGRWTAQMFLMFCLGRLDVLPVDDLGLRAGVQRAYQMEKLPEREAIEELARKWHPYCSVATWYFWRSLDQP